MSGSLLAGKVALVTGGASGIGAATAHLLAGHGAAVALLDREPRAGSSASSPRFTRRADRRRPIASISREIASIPAAVAEVLRAHGRIDILVNAAGISGDEGDILTQSEANWDRVLAINLKAPFRLIQEVGRHMVARGGGGRIVNVTSSSAHRARRVMAPYGAAKAGLAQLTRTAAADLGRYDINVNAVAPGVTMTPMTSDHRRRGGLREGDRRRAPRESAGARLAARGRGGCDRLPVSAGESPDHGPDDPHERRRGGVRRASPRLG